MAAAVPIGPSTRAERAPGGDGRERPLDVWNPGHDAAGWDVPGAGRDGFYVLDHPEPHRARASRLLKSHPEIRGLFGRNPWSAALVAGVVGLQIGLAWALASTPWWAIAAVAFLAGAFANHALWVLIHECAHNLLFAPKRANQAFGVLANLPLVVPSAESFRIFHLKHHQYQGDYDLDADVAGHWEAKLFRGGFWGKLAWEVFFPLAQALRTVRFSRTNKISFFTPGVVTNVAVQLAFDAAVLVLLGPGALAYLALSLLFSIGPHPLGARWIQEHFVVAKGQETFSYYGPANVVALNVGYHNEHHDFPFIAWNRLPELKAAAPEAYDCLVSHRSWTRLWLRFLLDPELTLYSRATRDARVNRTRVAQPEGSFAPDTLDVVEGATAS